MLLQSVEAARECGMACVVVAGRNPLYELTAADLVVKQLQELSFVNLKQLFGMERRVDPRVSWACVLPAMVTELAATLYVSVFNWHHLLALCHM